MTTQSFRLKLIQLNQNRLKLTQSNQLKLKVNARIPASIDALTPILIDKSGGVYTISLDMNTVIANLPPSGVASVFGRTGDVTAQTGDYTFAQIGSTPTTLSGYGITDAQPLDSDLTAIAALTTTSFGRGYLTLADASASRTYLSLVPGTDIQAYDSDLAALAANSTNGLWARTGSGTGAARTITGPAAGITVSNGDGVSGNPTLALANDLSALEGLSSTGLAARTGTDAWAQRTITGPAAGITVTNGSGASGNPTLALANDLSALEALSSTGIAVRTTTDTWAQRTITGTANAISVTNGDGVSGNPTLAISTDAALPGNPTTTTQAIDNNTTRVATTAYVVGQAAAASPLGNAATAVVGTSTRFARADHVHPGREQLTASRTYYVRTDGSNSNTGLVNSSGGAFLTIQKAVDIVAALDISIYTVTISVGAGTYTAGATVAGPWVGSGTVQITGDTTTPSNVVVNATGDAFYANSGGRLTIGGFKITSTGIALHAATGGVISATGLMEFGANSSYYAYGETNGAVNFTANFTCSGSAFGAFGVAGLGSINISSRAATISGTPAYASAFAVAGTTGLIIANGFSFSGAGATGPRYNATTAGGIFTFGGGASFFPGNSAGSATSPGWYN